MSSIFKKFLIFSVLASLSLAAFAQDKAGAGAPAPEGEIGADIIKESLGDLTLVAVAGLSGAVLGLSTLSFVDEPSEHLDNIVVGGALGIIVGVGVVAYLQAVKSEDKYEEADPGYGFNTRSRMRWARESHKKVSTVMPTQFGYQLTF